MATLGTTSGPPMVSVAHPCLLDPTNKRIRVNQNLGTTASLKLGCLYLKYHNSIQKQFIYRSAQGANLTA